MLESTRASMAAAMVPAGTTRSSAVSAVHLPVPFCPALSSTISTSGLPVRGSLTAKICEVISIRYDLREVWFQSSKDPRKLVGAEAKGAMQQVISFGDELHVAILNAVVHHLDEVPGAVGADMGDARAGIAFGGDSREHGL